MIKNTPKGPLHSPRLNYEWITYDVVQLCKEWCVVCAKQRIHETYKEWAVCVECGQQTYKPPVQTEVLEDVQPGFQVMRFIGEHS